MRFEAAIIAPGAAKAGTRPPSAAHAPGTRPPSAAHPGSQAGTRPPSAARIATSQSSTRPSGTRPPSASTRPPSAALRNQSPQPTHSPREQSKWWNSASSLLDAFAMDRFPPLLPLGKPLQGCRSSPTLLPSRHGFQISLMEDVSSQPLQSGAATANSDARPASGSSWRIPGAGLGSVASARRAILAAGAAGTKPVKNSSVWQRWQVHSTSNRAQSEVVLERDRQRQRAYACDLRGGPARQAASPARSHAASLFFGPAGTETASCLPPGALRHVARPDTRSMHLMPNASSGDRGQCFSEKPNSSPAEESRPKRSRSASGLSAGSPKNAPSEPVSPGGHSIGSGSPKNSVVARAAGDLPDVNMLFETKHLVEMIKCVDSFCGLVTPPAPGANSSDMALSGSLAGLSSPTAAPAASPPQELGILKDKEGPMVLRPIFCRFLLSSKLCGRSDSEHRYHECVAAFDAHATRSESFSGMPRNFFLRVLAGIVVPPDGERAMMRAAFEAHGEAADSTSSRRLPPEVQGFIGSSLKYAQNHSEERREILDVRIAQLPAVAEWPEEPSPTVDEEAEKEKEREREREREEEEKRKGKGKKGQPPQKANTDRKPMPGATGRHTREEEQKAAASAKRAEGEKQKQDESHEAEAKSRLPPVGVWPPLPPKYVQDRDLHSWSQGIDQWKDEINMQSSSHLRALYAHTATVVRGELLSSQLLEPEVLHFATRFQPLFIKLFDAYADEHSDSTFRGASPDQMSFAAFFRFCCDFELFPGHASFEEVKQMYDDAECKHDLGGSTTPMDQARPRKLTPHASASAAAALPKADFDFFNKRLKDLSDLELRAIFFFSSAEEWLSCRFFRLPDLVAMRIPECLEELEEEPVKRTRKQRTSKDEARPPEDKLARPPSATQRPPSATQRPPSATQRTSSSTDDWKQSKERRPSIAVPVEPKKPAVVQLSPSWTLSASTFMDLVMPPKPEASLTVAELEQVFLLLLGLPLDSKERVEISVYQLDKALSRAKLAVDRFRLAASPLMKPRQEMTISERNCIKFFEAFDELLINRSRWDNGQTEDVLGDTDVFTAKTLIEKANNMGLGSENFPHPEELSQMMKQTGGDPSSGVMPRHLVYRMLAIAHESNRHKRSNTLKSRLNFVANQGNLEGGAQAEKPAVPVDQGFGCPAFVESLLKLVLHRLGSKGLSEIQRCAPAWWKCTWLFAHLSNRFKDSVCLHRHHQCLQELTAGAAADTSSAASADLDAWWRRVYTAPLPRYVQPTEVLVRSAPDIFEHEEAEAPVAVPEDVLFSPTCPACQEQRSPSGWGSPGCVLCSGIERNCLPFDNHIFSKLVKNVDSLTVGIIEEEDDPASERSFDSFS
eukprot:TRINITY_DN25437_c1_g1_i1.p1 TRINITY_DN25437_c1_g1~~TRINITY_DN25437_c1_g1_i1.p1  ORF type:complete len:1400 (+),score=234.40 TRINITY_DN25437_c1_g1_i1:130-4200(+)